MKTILIIAVVVHLVPMLGVFIEDDKWYKYPYILVSYASGLSFFLWKYSMFLKNDNSDGDNNIKGKDRKNI